MAKAARPARPLTPEEKALLATAYTIVPLKVAAYRRLCHAAGYEAEEAVQEIVMVFADRLQGAHPFDPAKAKLSTYLHMLTYSILLNRIARRQRRAKGLADLTQHDMVDLDIYLALEMAAAAQEASKPAPPTPTVELAQQARVWRAQLSLVNCTAPRSGPHDQRRHGATVVRTRAGSAGAQLSLPFNSEPPGFPQGGAKSKGPLPLAPKTRMGRKP